MSATKSRYDVVILGAGHNGLVAAAYLGRAGLSVLLLEKNDYIGGATTSQQVFPDYDARLSRYSYLVSLLPHKIIHDLERPGHAQFLIATHSPILLSYPDAVLFGLDGQSIQEISYRETKHFLITRDFLNSPERFFKHLFGSSGEDRGDS